MRPMELKISLGRGCGVTHFFQAHLLLEYPTEIKVSLFIQLEDLRLDTRLSIAEWPARRTSNFSSMQRPLRYVGGSDISSWA